MRLAWTAMFVVAMAGLALAADGGEDEKKSTPAPTGNIDPGDRIGRLEKEIEQLKAETALRNAGLPATLGLEEQDKMASKPGEAEFKVSFTDGFHLKTNDGNFDLHVGGRWEEEYRYTFGRRVDGGFRTAVNTFYIREAFLTMDGTLFHDFGFKINGDFTPPQTSINTFTVNNAPPAQTLTDTNSTGAIAEEFWVEWKEFKEVRILFGQFKEPISFETTDSPRFAELIQRSPMARFLPNFEIGIKVYGSILDSLLTYELAVVNGRSHLANIGRNMPDDNDGKEYALRLTTAPFVQDKESPLKGLRLGIYGSYAREGQGATINPNGWPGGISTNELGVNFLNLNAAAFRFNGERYRVGTEFTYAYGPFMVRGEFMERNDEVEAPVGGPHSLLRTMGYYVEATFVLTGEDRIPNARIVPRHNLNLSEGTFGAVEFAVRFGGVNLDSAELNTMATAFATNANGARDLTIGFNWWLCQNMKICLNFVKEGYDGIIPLSATISRNHAEGILMHFQVDF